MAGDPLIGKTLADRFEILERIGEGGTGVVYKARQLSVDRIIAIKILAAHVATDPSWVKRFHNEARAASRLDHPNTVRLFDFGQTKEGLIFIAMEYLSGISLRQAIDRGKFSSERMLKVMAQICSSLAEAHKQGVIHRDIKPDNIYLIDAKGDSDFVKVLDFSVAKLDGAGSANVTRAGVVFGTPAYMSPEQARGVKLDARSDLYSMGVLGYEMVMGRPPFDGQIPTEVVLMHLRDRPPPLVGISGSVAQIIMQALEKEPARRQGSAEELEAQCLACLRDLEGGKAQAAINAEAATLAAAPQTPPPAPVRVTAPPGIAEQRTLIAAPAPVIAPQGTMMLPSSEGVVAYAAEQAEQARAHALESAANRTPPPSPLFWLSWIMLGIGGGLGLYFIQWSWR